MKEWERKRQRKGGHSHVGSSQPFLRTKKRRDRGSLRENRFEEDHVKSDSSREGSTYGHVRAERARLVPVAVEKERTARLPSPYSRDPLSFPLLLVRNRGGQRGIHSCTHSQNATCVRVCPVHARDPWKGPARRDMAERRTQVPSTMTRISARSEKCRTKKYIEYDKRMKNILVIAEHL